MEFDQAIVTTDGRRWREDQLSEDLSTLGGDRPILARYRRIRLISTASRITADAGSFANPKLHFISEPHFGQINGSTSSILSSNPVDSPNAGLTVVLARMTPALSPQTCHAALTSQ